MAAGNKRGEKRGSEGPDGERIRKKNREIADLQKKLKEAKQGGGGKGGRNGKGGKDGKGAKSSLPRELLGKSSRNASGEPICYNYNLEARMPGRPAWREVLSWLACLRGSGLRQGPYAEDASLTSAVA